MKESYFGNRETKVLHKSFKKGDACRAAEIKRANQIKFDSEAAAKKQGYRLCKNCFR